MERLTLDNFNWTNGLFIIGYHIALAIGLPFYFASQTPGWPLIALSALLAFGTSIGITAGYHRLFAHKTYDAHPLVRWTLLFFGTLSTQGSALSWACDHRKHHAHVDTDKDPYAITRGFWYAHILWLFHRQPPMDERLVGDLVKDPVLRFQHRHYAWLMVATNALTFALIGWAVGDFLGAFVIAWWLRLAITHHLTWFINSAAHFWGERTFSQEHTARDNFVLAFLTVGEGYHNYHHTFASDYRNGHRWYHFDPGKWVIWTLSRVGLTHGLKRSDRWAIQRKLVQEDRKLLLEHLRQQMRQGSQNLEQQVTGLATRITEKLQAIRLSTLERASESCKERRRAMRLAIKQLKRDLREDQRNWRRLCRAILSPATS